MPTSKKQELDSADFAIIRIMSDNARISMRDLAQKVGLSSPSISERVKRLQENGTIQGFNLALNARSLGYRVEAIARIRPLPGELHRVEKMIQEIPNCIECDKVTGEDCFIARFVLFDIELLDDLFQDLSKYASTSTSIVKGKSVARRNPPLMVGAD